MAASTCPFRPEDVVGIHEVATQASVSVEQAASWTRHPSFPRPLVTLDIGTLYWLPEVEDWLRKPPQPV